MGKTQSKPLAERHGRCESIKLRFISATLRIFTQLQDAIWAAAPTFCDSGQTDISAHGVNGLSQMLSYLSDVVEVHATPCRWLRGSRRFVRTSCLHLQGFSSTKNGLLNPWTINLHHFSKRRNLPNDTASQAIILNPGEFAIRLEPSSTEILRLGRPWWHAGL
jgi:hypothetical protein